jgi:signal transduction histidine kinase/DNA-binding NarL/FixJ family response regulator
VLRQWWLNRTVRAKGMIVVAVPLVALIAVSLASLMVQTSERHQRSISRVAFALSSAATQVLADAVNAETGVRGYVATGQPVLLGPYNSARDRMPADLANLRAAAMTQGATAQEQSARVAMARVMSQLDRLRAGVAAGDPPSSLRSGLITAQASMDDLRGEIARLTIGPSAAVAIGSARISSLETTIGVVSYAGLALGLLAGVAGIALFTTGVSRRVVQAADNAGRLGAGQTLVPVPGSRDEIGRLGAALVRADGLLASREAELIEARDEALQATQAKNAFLSSTSHELRTPLNSVLGFTQLLQLSDLSPEDRDGVDRILTAGRHLLALINELVDIARIESGDFSLSVEPVSVQPLIREACQLMEPLAAQRGITIQHEQDDPELAVRADRQRLSQVLVNLISNAVKYNREGGAITVTCRVAAAAGQVSIAVSDTGPGIPAADLDRVFVPFERLGADQTAIEGTGIGLPLARAFAEAMSGTLTASSGPGQGSAFTLTLPRSQDMFPTPSAPAAPLLVPAASTDGVRHRILYIEDNPANIEVVSRFLRTRPNIALEQAATGQTGLEQAIRNPPDLILLDMHLPDLRGDEVLKRLKAEPATASLPIAILSAEAAPAIIRRMRDNGVISYLTKPLNLTELGQLIDANLAPASAEPVTGTEPAASAAPASGVAFESAEEADASGAAPPPDGTAPAAPSTAHRKGRVRRSGSASKTGPGT